MCSNKQEITCEASLVVQMVKKSASIVGDPGSDPWQPTPVFLPGESHGQGSLASYNPQGHKESNMTE